MIHLEEQPQSLLLAAALAAVPVTPSTVFRPSAGCAGSAARRRATRGGDGAPARGPPAGRYRTRAPPPAARPAGAPVRAEAPPCTRRLAPEATRRAANRSVSALEGPTSTRRPRRARCRRAQIQVAVLSSPFSPFAPLPSLPHAAR